MIYFQFILVSPISSLQLENIPHFPPSPPFLFYFISSKNQQIQYKSLNLILLSIKQTMKSTLFAALVGIATAGGQLRTNDQFGSSFLGSSSGFIGGSSISGSIEGGSSYISGFGSGTQNIGVTTGGILQTGATGLSSATGLSNVGTGAVIAASGFGSNIASGGVLADGGYPKADLTGLSGASSSLVNNNVVAQNIINASFASTVTPSRSIDSIFGRLPNSDQIDKLILSADSVGLLRTIQAVAINQSLPCAQRIAYLLELLGRLKAAVAKKTFAASQLKIVIEAALKQINRLQGLIDANKSAIDKLDIDGLKSRLNKFLGDLQSSYVEYNKVQTQIPVVQAQIKGTEQEIQILYKNNDAVRNALANDKIKLSDVANQIASIQSKLRDLQDRRVAIQNSINRGQANIAANERSIVDINIKIEQLQAQIRALTDQADSFNSRAKELEVKVERLRADISINEIKRAKLLRDIDDLNNRISIERKKNLPDQLLKLNDMIIALRDLVPNVQSQIDRHYYYCFGEGKVQVRVTGGVVIYIVRGQAFGNYLKNLYGQTIVVPSGVNSDVLFNKINIFGDDWVGAFGYPFLSESLVGDDLSIGGFGCLNPSALVTGSGTISAIGSNYIQALGGDGGRIRFGLGSCSRLESTSRIPVVGQKFYWSGVPDGKGYNLYAGSCFN